MMKASHMILLLDLGLGLGLLLNCVHYVSADDLHEDIAITACSDTDAEDMYGLDGEEISYVDFINKKVVEPQPDFIDHMTAPGQYEQAVAQQHVCKTNLGLTRGAMKDMPMNDVSPSAPIIYVRDEVLLDVQNTLVCHVSGFYPAPVQVQWTHNERNVSGSATGNVPYPSKDGTFSQISRLEFTPKQGDIYSCTVQHPALSTPLTRIWDVDVPQSSVGPAVFCGLGLTVGLLGVATGTFFLIKGNECS